MVATAHKRLASFREPEADRIRDLPPAGMRHWAPRHKAAVVAAVTTGVLSLRDACARYRLTEEEFQSWKDALEQDGVEGLRATVRNERRKGPRQRVSEAGVALLYAAAAAECIITDIGDHGARLVFDSPVVLPETFELRCEASGRSWWVSVIWSNGEVAGVRFNNPLPPPWAIKSGLGAWLLGRRSTVSMDRLTSPLATHRD
jgi:hypothetical protein